MKVIMKCLVILFQASWEHFLISLTTSNCTRCIILALLEHESNDVFRNETMYSGAKTEESCFRLLSKLTTVSYSGLLVGSTHMYSGGSRNFCFLGKSLLPPTSSLSPTTREPKPSVCPRVPRHPLPLYIMTISPQYRGNEFYMSGPLTRPSRGIRRCCTLKAVRSLKGTFVRCS